MLIILYKLLNLLDRGIKRCCESLNERIEGKRLIKLLRKASGEIIRIDGDNGTVLLIKNENTPDDVTEKIKSILVVAPVESPVQPTLSFSLDGLDHIDGEKTEGFMIKEIKFNNYMNKEELLRILKDEMSNEKENEKINEKINEKENDKEVPEEVEAVAETAEVKDMQYNPVNNRKKYIFDNSVVYAKGNSRRF